MAAVWYRKEFTLPDDWNSGRVLIHFGAVDYDSEVWVNGQSVGTHRGGYTPFTFDITDFLKKGINVVTVYAEDDVRSGLQPGGKQCPTIIPEAATTQEPPVYGRRYGWKMFRTVTYLLSG